MKLPDMHNKTAVQGVESSTLQEEQLQQALSLDTLRDHVAPDIVVTAVQPKEKKNIPRKQKFTNSLVVRMIDKTAIGQIKKLSKYTEPESNTEVVSKEIARSKKFEENSQSELELELVKNKLLLKLTNLLLLQIHHKGLLRINVAITHINKWSRKDEDLV